MPDKTTISGPAVVLFLCAALICLPSALHADLIALSSLETSPDSGISTKPGSLFPNMYFTEVQNALQVYEASRPYWVYSESEIASIGQMYEDHASILLNNDILAFYGHPNSRNMGILGRYSIEELDRKLTELALEYEKVSGGRPVRRAFYLIYGTVWPEGEIGILREDIIKRYLEYCMENDILVFLDHQIGRYDPVDSLKRMFPWLAYPNVHLALDPEWRTSKPMVEIGTISAEELNRAQQLMEDYIIDNNLPGERLLVIHQFNWRMIRNRENGLSNFRRVRLIHCADGFGSPHLKRSAYAYNAEAANMPVKGFKLFYNFEIPGVGYDYPLMTPQEVYNLNPRPYVIMYQ